MNPAPRDLEEELLDEDEDGNEILKGHGVSTTGPSDSSDSGADNVGLGRSDDTSDRNGTGEVRSLGEDVGVRDGADIRPDRIIRASQAGLGGGLDQAEEAQLEITDEEIADRDELDGE